MTIVKVGILLFPGIEVLDFAGPFEVFSVAARLGSNKLERPPPTFEVVTIGQHRAPIVARHGLQVIPDHDFRDAPEIEVLIVPGGVVEEALEDDATLGWLRDAAARAELVASVCTGAFLLAKIGLLDGLSATTHWEDLEDLQKRFPSVMVVGETPYVDQGRIVTSAGISAGISMSLYLVSRLAAPGLAYLTARQMQYDWEPA